MSPSVSSASSARGIAVLVVGNDFIGLAADSTRNRSWSRNGVGRGVKATAEGTSMTTGGDSTADDAMGGGIFWSGAVVALRARFFTTHFFPSTIRKLSAAYSAGMDIAMQKKIT